MESDNDLVTELLEKPAFVDERDSPPLELRPTATELYAEVAVSSPTGVMMEGLTYRVPVSLQEHILPGQLVWCPIKDKRAQGVVMGLSRQRPSVTTRDIIEVVDARPALLPYQLDLARWLSSYYYAGLYEAATLMLPPGMTHAAKPTLTLAPEFLVGLLPANLNQNEVFLIDLMREMQPAKATSSSPLPFAKLKNAYIERRGKTTFEKTVKHLVEIGLLQSGFQLPGSSLKPQIKPFVRLSPLLDELKTDPAKLAKKIGKSPKQQLVVEYLQQHSEPGYLLPAEEVYEAVQSDMATLRAMVKKGLLEIEEREVRRNPLAKRGHRTRAEEPPLLTFQQGVAWRSLFDSFQRPESEVFLLHGVTGSGKTELYLRAIARVLKEGKQAIVLVPEIALTGQTVDRFAARFPGQIAVRHSSLSPGEAYDEWRRVRDGQAAIVIGARSALFSPVPNLGLIIIDEEHEASYKQDEIASGQPFPLYHARTVAIELARLTGAKVILGSATPSVESYFMAQTGAYTLLELPDRVSPDSPDPGDANKSLPLPPVQVVDLRQELKAGNTSIFSRDLRHLLQETLAAKHQAILFLNRRGTATIVLCRDCGHVEVCPSCETPTVWHADLEKLICHRCGKFYPHPTECRECGSSRIRFMGTGTKRVEDEVIRLFPHARVLRWDQDTISEGGRGSYQLLYDQMAQGEADILVGTQMIAKGLDLPLVSLVGVVTADTGIYLPDPRSAERTFQVLTQVAGRAGRRSRTSRQARVIFQSYTPQNPSILAAANHNYRQFYDNEISFRLERGYPPFAHLIKFVYSSPREDRAKLEVERLHAELQTQIEWLSLPDDSYDFIGPAPAPQRKLRDHYRYQLIVRFHRPDSQPPSPEEQTLRHAIADLRYKLLHGWTIDVDPQSLL